MRTGAVGVVAAIALVAGFMALATVGREPRDPAPVTQVEEFTVPPPRHTEGAVAYDQQPPVGGDHAPVWQDCGFYDEPVPDVTAVHSLEHGAVWITYRPDLPAAELAALRRLAASQTFILVSPFQDLPAPVVASAWGRQLRLEGATDPRLATFVTDFRVGPQTLEPGAPCTNGYGGTA